MKNRIILALAASVMLSACSGTPDEPQAQASGPEVAYERARELMAQGNLSMARDALNNLSSRYPFGAYANQVQLDLIYLNYKLDDTDKALATIDRFIRLNPNHQDIDYAIYMRGLVNQRAEHNTIQELVGVERYDRDPSRARDAFKDFADLIRQYPDSKYVPDAKQRLVALKSRLAKYELAAARYYMDRAAYLAAANRGKYILEYYPNTPEVEEALAIMVESYDQLDLPKMRDDARKVLQLNYPENPMASAD
ncbi:outer membrane protein assembly factor BamD [Idiomarina xiamenensis]|uniref:Outer membrane protein assembly factor BamD n=1 Tax=Idiomarina xiamenensis 10-D-4 TaxID=740709 RepID=K2KSE4_9GAMM|nr:outer membrane protein assembly factor BamD [Idiomarina xiamenensis]EKE80525.1 competence lipoprotein ComL [Idiomarina xiamenensis 10-D-4]